MGTSFETQPELPSALGKSIAAAVRSWGLAAAAPVLAASSRRVARSSRGAVPHDPDAAKDYWTANRIEGAFEPGELGA
jgi:hypothetical protein